MYQIGRRAMADEDEYDYFEADDIHDGEIEVMMLPGRKVISLKVKGSDTIGSLKLQIQTKEHIPFNEQELIFNEKVVDNINTFADLCMVKRSMLELYRKSVESIVVLVNTFTGKTIQLFVKPTDTVADVKFEIYLKESINVDEQVVMFKKMVLGDTGTLFDCHINDTSTLTLMSKPRGFKGFMQIFIKNNLTGEIITLEVKPSDTIYSIKEKIQDEMHIPVDEQELIFKETKALHNDNTLADCNYIRSQSTLTLMRILTGFMTIFIKTIDEKVITLKNVKPSDTIYNVKSKIHDMEEVPLHQQRLMFTGTELEDGPTLADYHIPNESIIHLLLKISEGAVVKVKVLN